MAGNLAALITGLGVLELAFEVRVDKLFRRSRLAKILTDAVLCNLSLDVLLSLNRWVWDQNWKRRYDAYTAKPHVQSLVAPHDYSYTLTEQEHERYL